MHQDRKISWGTIETHRPISRSIQHIFDEDAVAGGGVIDKDVGILMMPTQAYKSAYLTPNTFRKRSSFTPSDTLHQFTG